MSSLWHIGSDARMDLAVCQALETLGLVLAKPRRDWACQCARLEHAQENMHHLWARLKK